MVRCYLIRMRLARPMWGQRRRRVENTNLTMTVLCLVMGTFSYPIQAGQAVGFTLWRQTSWKLRMGSRPTTLLASPPADAIGLRQMALRTERSTANQHLASTDILPLSHTPFL